MAVPAAVAQHAYPVRLEVEYVAEHSRWKALLRLPLSIPVLIFSSLIGNGVAVAIWATILVRRRIPRWLFDFQVAFNRWQVRSASYLLLLTDEYPPFEGANPIRYEVQYPEHPSRRRLVVWKFITTIPHFLVLAVLALTLLVVVPIGWFAILISGRFPKGLRWGRPPLGRASPGLRPLAHGRVPALQPVARSGSGRQEVVRRLVRDRLVCHGRRDRAVRDHLGRLRCWGAAHRGGGLIRPSAGGHNGA